MRKKRQQEELAQQQQQQLQLQEPFYVRANASTFTSTVEIKASPKDEVSSLGSGDRPNVTILAPISICLGAMLCYIIAGAFTLHKLDGWSFVGKFPIGRKKRTRKDSLLRSSQSEFLCSFRYKYPTNFKEFETYQLFLRLNQIDIKF